jgi:hypothetical protein
MMNTMNKMKAPTPQVRKKGKLFFRITEYHDNQVLTAFARPWSRSAQTAGTIASSLAGNAEASTRSR